MKNNQWFNKDDFNRDVEIRASQRSRRLKIERDAFVDLVGKIAGNHTLATAIGEQLATFHDLARNHGKIPFFTHKKLASLRRNSINEPVQHRNTSRDIVKPLFIAGLLLPARACDKRLREDPEKLLKWQDDLLNGRNLAPAGFCNETQRTPYIINWALVRQYINGGYSPALEPMKKFVGDDLANRLSSHVRSSQARKQLSQLQSELKTMEKDIRDKYEREYAQIEREPRGVSREAFEAYSARRVSYIIPRVTEEIHAIKQDLKSKKQSLESVIST